MYSEIVTLFLSFWTGVFTREKMADMFSYESSEIDWCEDNYKHSEHIVESFNTVSLTSVLHRSNWSVCWGFFFGRNPKSHPSQHTDQCLFQMSSFVFFIIAPIMLYLLHPYAKERNLAIHLVWIMMIFVGQSP